MSEKSAVKLDCRTVRLESHGKEFGLYSKSNGELHRTLIGKLYDFPGGPVLRTLYFHCHGPGFDPWSGN